MIAWKPGANRRIRALTPDEAAATIARIAADGITIEHADVRRLTGGYASQSINAYVLRRLGVRAGIIKNPR